MSIDRRSSSQNYSPTNEKAALREIVEVVTSPCETHHQQGQGLFRRSSESHGQGIAGTDEPCFAAGEGLNDEVVGSIGEPSEKEPTCIAEAGEKLGVRSGQKTGEKRGARRMISLGVLQQYFARSLKDAAKSIGVCPTTLKRICRQHGITRWPSRKIKKVDHSLRKLQLVIDSTFPQLSSPQEREHHGNNDKRFSPISRSNVPNRSHSDHHQNDFFISGGSSMKSQSSSRACSVAELLALNQHEARLKQISEKSSVNGFAFRIKANFGDKTIRFRVLPECSFRDLKAEIASRFSLDDLSKIDIKYLDDDREWVLLTCSADLKESFELHQQSQNHTIRLCLQQASLLNEEAPFRSN